MIALSGMLTSGRLRSANALLSERAIRIQEYSEISAMRNSERLAKELGDGGQL